MSNLRIKPPFIHPQVVLYPRTATGYLVLLSTGNVLAATEVILAVASRTPILGPTVTNSTSSLVVCMRIYGTGAALRSGISPELRSLWISRPRNPIHPLGESQ